jgi:hypothetical protein
MQVRQDEILPLAHVSQGDKQLEQFKPLGYVLAGQLSMQLLFNRYLKEVAVSQEVQLVLKVEQVKQGARHPRQVAFTKKSEVSWQERQLVADKHVLHGFWQAIHFELGASS